MKEAYFANIPVLAQSEFRQDSIPYSKSIYDELIYRDI
jgi:hypothetical protein